METKILPKLSHVKYSDRLKMLATFTTLSLEQKRYDRNIQPKILTDKYDMVAVPNLSIATTVITRVII